jgi:Bacterial Ig-like domain
MRLRVVLVALLAGLAAGARAQDEYALSRYEMQYGEAIDVSLETLLDMPESYSGRAVRTQGTLDLVSQTQTTDRVYALGTFGRRAIILPVAEARGPFDSDALRWLGREVEITGVVGTGTDPQRGTTTVIITFWAYYGPPDEKEGPPPRSEDVTLENLVTRPGQYDGRVVRVLGQFRGANLFGDLPSASRRRSDDWVVKEDLFAAWVSGKKPRGSGWRLDPSLHRDTGKWLEVQGRVRTIRGVVYIEAMALSLTKPRASLPEAKAPELPPPPPPEPPVIVFSLPLDGERDVAPNSFFKVQFSKDMDETTFKGRVVFRYAGRPRPGDRPLDAVKIDYDEGRKALIVDPGDLLRPGRVVELLLLPGIVDLDGLPLEARPGLDPGGAAEVLRFRISTEYVAGRTSPY